MSFYKLVHVLQDGRSQVGWSEHLGYGSGDHLSPIPAGECQGTEGRQGIQLKDSSLCQETRTYHVDNFITK